MHIESSTRMFLFLLFFSLGTLTNPIPVPAQCKNCKQDRGFEFPEFPATEEGAKKYYFEIKKKADNHTLDNPEDLTTQRSIELDRRFDHMSKKALKPYEKVLFPLYVDLLKNDLYPQIQNQAMIILLSCQTITDKEKLEALYSALNNQNEDVQMAICSNILSYCKTLSISPDPKVLNILYDFASGKTRSIWNAKGLYSQNELKNNPSLIDSVKDEIQNGALRSLEHSGLNTYLWLDSISRNSTDDEDRKAALHGLLIQGYSLDPNKNNR